MKINKNLLYLGFTLVVIAMVISPNIIQKALIIDSGNGDDDESTLLLTPPTPPSEQTFPNSSFSYITDFTFIEGYNTTGNLLECLDALKYDDGINFEILGDTGVGGYYYNIEFLFDVDLINHYVEYYDLFLFLQIDASFNAEIVYFQVYSDGNWINLEQITNQIIEINREFIECTTKFRLYASDTLKIGSQKIISIDSLYFLIAHEGNLEDLNPNGHTSGVVTRRDGRSFNLKYDDNYPFPTDFYTDSASHIWQSTYKDAGDGGDMYLVFDVEMTLLPSQLWNSKYGIPDLWIDHLYRIVTDDNTFTAWISLYLYNYQTTSWDQTHSYGYNNNDGNHYLKSHWYNIDFNKYISNNKWKFKLYVFGNIGNVWYKYIKQSVFECKAELVYNFPKIEDIYTNPSSPLNTLEQFEIKTDLSDHITSIDTVEYYIEDWNTEWQSMEKIGTSHTWKNSETINGNDFPNGQYIVWIKAIDSMGTLTYDYYIFEISNAQPTVSFLTPQKENEKIDQLYNYNVNISIYEEEGDSYEVPEILIYKDNISEPLLDWTVMEQNYIGNPPLPSILHYWNYSFNPIDFENGLYKIIVKTNDTRQIIVYNETLVNIINNPPSIEILQPIISELITPMDWQIECNITNEDPINTAQWDIVSNLNVNFTWKDLTYNITTKYWEANFSILNYEYGDYYLVINATDDKYNSSIETKQIQLHPLIIYNIDEGDISYNDNGIYVYSNEIVTTEIRANFELTHHIIANERDFEIYIPEKFDDAENYYINRGFTKYEPLGFFTEGIYTEWEIMDYNSIDTVFFTLEKPKLINSLIHEDDDDIITMEFILSSKHPFINIHIENELTKYLSDPDNYEYTLYYLYMGKWHEVNDYDVEAEVFPEFSFTWGDIGEDSVISFKFKAEPIDTEPSNIGGYVTFAFGGLAIACVPTQIYFLAKKKYKPKEEDGWGLTKYILITVAFGVGGFIGGWIGGWLIYG